jgi:hypothetical protein
MIDKSKEIVQSLLADETNLPYIVELTFIFDRLTSSVFSAKEEGQDRAIYDMASKLAEYLNKPGALSSEVDSLTQNILEQIDDRNNTIAVRTVTMLAIHRQNLLAGVLMFIGGFGALISLDAFILLSPGQTVMVMPLYATVCVVIFMVSLFLFIFSITMKAHVRTYKKYVGPVLKEKIDTVRALSDLTNCHIQKWKET